MRQTIRGSTPHRWTVTTERSTAEIVADLRDPLRAESVIRMCREAADLLTELDDMLAEIWLYVDWRYLTKQMTLTRKEMWADAVDANGEPGPKADRWWRE